MSDPVNAALLILRVGLGIVFLLHGVKHARGRHKTSNWFAAIGFRKAELQWFNSTATEIGAGMLLVLGLLTSFAAAGVVGIMAVAFWTVHRSAGFFITNFMKEGIDVEGWEYVFTLAFAAVAVSVAGPGEWSLDEALDVARLFDGWVGLLLAGGGLAAAAGLLAAFWRPPRSR